MTSIPIAVAEFPSYNVYVAGVAGSVDIDYRVSAEMFTVVGKKRRIVSGSCDLRLYKRQAIFDLLDKDD